MLIILALHWIMYKITKFFKIKKLNPVLCFLLKTLLSVHVFVTVFKKIMHYQSLITIWSPDNSAVIGNGFTLKIRLVGWCKLFIFLLMYFCFKAYLP